MFIVAQTTYSDVEVGLHDGARMLQQASLHKHDASAQLIVALDALLMRESITLADITGIIVNTGPAPFTTLRTLITTMNGIAFASQVPLYDVSLFEALAHAHEHDAETMLILLPAYAGDYYYALYKREALLDSGTTPKTTLPHNQENPTLIITINIPDISAGIIADTYGSKVKNHRIAYSTLKQVAECGLQKIKTGAASVLHISPCYIKTHF